MFSSDIEIKMMLISFETKFFILSDTGKSGKCSEHCIFRKFWQQSMFFNYSAANFDLVQLYVTNTMKIKKKVCHIKIIFILFAYLKVHWGQRVGLGMVNLLGSKHLLILFQVFYHLDPFWLVG